MGGLGRDDFPLMKKESPGHLKAVASEVAHTAAFEDRECGAPPHLWAEKLNKTSLAEAKGAVEFAAGICDAGDSAAFAEVLRFFAILQHVDENQFCSMLARFFINSFEASENLASECTAEVAEENQGEQSGVRSLRKCLPG